MSAYREVLDLATEAAERHPMNALMTGDVCRCGFRPEWDPVDGPWPSQRRHCLTEVLAAVRGDIAAQAVELHRAESGCAPVNADRLVDLLRLIRAATAARAGLNVALAYATGRVPAGFDTRRDLELAGCEEALDQLSGALAVMPELDLSDEDFGR